MLFVSAGDARPGLLFDSEPLEPAKKMTPEIPIIIKSGRHNNVARRINWPLLLIIKSMNIRQLYFDRISLPFYSSRNSYQRSKLFWVSGVCGLGFRE